MQPFEAIGKHFHGDKIVGLMVEAVCKIQGICYKVQMAKVATEEKERIFNLCEIRQRAIMHCSEGPEALDDAKEVSFKANADWAAIFKEEQDLVIEQAVVNKENFIHALQLLEKVQGFLREKGVVKEGFPLAKTDDFEKEKAHKVIWELAGYEKMFAQVELLQTVTKDGTQGSPS